MNWKKWIRPALIVIFAALFFTGAGLLGKYFWQSRQHKGQFDDLAQMVEQAKPTEPAQEQEDPAQTVPDATVPEATEPESELVPVVDPQTGETVMVLPEYAQLYALNNHMVGWITIEDTPINYPVMQNKESKDYYLHRDFYHEQSNHGCIYVREQCDVFAPSDNVVIYGHRMKDGTMFRELLKYEKKSYFEEHPIIIFNTLTERHTYQVIAVFKTVGTSSGFGFHQMNDAASAEEFEAFVAKCKALSLYDTGVDAVYGDKLISLCTCEYSQYNGRMVVVAKRIT